MSAQGYPVILKLTGANGQWLGEERLTISGRAQSISFASGDTSRSASAKTAPSRSRSPLYVAERMVVTSLHSVKEL